AQAHDLDVRRGAGHNHDAGAYRSERCEGGPLGPALELVYLDDGDVTSLGALRAILDLVLNSRALGEGLEPLGLDRAEVDENVLAAVGRGDEPVALGVVEPLHGAGCHAEHLLLPNSRTGREAHLRATCDSLVCTGGTIATRNCVSSAPSG